MQINNFIVLFCHLFGEDLCAKSRDQAHTSENMSYQIQHMSYNVFKAG